jgi:uncharacterized protein (TIGR03435 family)
MSLTMRITLGLMILGAAFGQSPNASKFEVAAIKPNNADPHSGGVSTGNGLLRSINVTLKRSIMGAYNIGPNQIIGGPDWMGTDRFDIVAKAEQRAGDQELMIMLQSLMAERFKLAIHRETRPMQVYVMEVAKPGKLEKDEGGTSTANNGHGSIDARNTSMDRFAEVLSRQADLPVLNRTGLDGVYKIDLKWSMDPSRGPSSPEAPSLYTAIQEQLGLRLRAQKMPLEVLVIDHAERPTEN